jgi:hypothetical protein
MKQPLTFVRVGELRTFSFTEEDHAMRIARHLVGVHQVRVLVVRNSVTLADLSPS